VTAFAVPPAERYALIEGEIVVAFTDRPPEHHHLAVIPGEPLPLDALKPAYRRWCGIELPDDGVEAEVVSTDDLALFDPAQVFARHLRIDLPASGQLVVLRVRVHGREVLSDVAFGARVRAVTTAMR